MAEQDRQRFVHENKAVECLKIVKNPQNSFSHFRNAKHEQFKADNPKIKLAFVSKMCGEIWKAMSEVQRQPY